MSKEESGVRFSEKYVAFIDILGFKSLVELAEKGEQCSLQTVLDILDSFNESNYVKDMKKYGPSICPRSQRNADDLNFFITQASDSVVASCEVSPAGLINLIFYSWQVVFKLLMEGLLCRGYITKGSMYHSADRFVGSAFQKAVEKEKTVQAFKKELTENGTPFVEIDQLLIDDIDKFEDKCVREMSNRMVEKDGSIAVIFPFKRLSHDFIPSGYGKKFDPREEKENVENLRKEINELKEKVLKFIDGKSELAMKKTKYYLEALDRQLLVCDQTDQHIDMLASPLGYRRREK